MENTKTLGEAVISYVIETNKQVYDFNMRMAKDYAEFSKNAMKMVPGMDAWVHLIPSSLKK